MPDNPTSSGSATPTSPPASGNGPQHRPPLPNQAILDELSKAEKICLKAQKAEYAGPLAAREITAEDMTATLTKIQQARAKAAEATQATSGKRGVTKREQDAKDALMTCIVEIQKAAKQKARKTELSLDDYFVGERIDQNRARLEQLAAQIIAKAAASALPGITPAKITAANDALTGYTKIESDQTGAQGEATGGRTSLKQLVREITNTRIAIQLAADAEWPHANPVNAALRREFQLPPDRALRG